MFREIRRKDRIMAQEDCLLLLRKGEYGFLSIGINENGYAYGIPLNYVYDPYSNEVYFHGANEGEKLDVLSGNKQVSFCVVGNTTPLPEKFSTCYESIILFGNITTDLPDEEKKKGLLLLISKYSPDYLEEGNLYLEKAFLRTRVLKLEIRHMTGKKRG